MNGLFLYIIAVTGCYYFLRENITDKEIADRYKGSYLISFRNIPNEHLTKTGIICKQIQRVANGLFLVFLAYYFIFVKYDLL
jgi:hypothetical protein